MAETNIGGVRLEPHGKQKETGEFRLNYPLLTADSKQGGLNLSTSTAASTAITNTTTEALLDTTYTLPANTLEPGRRLRIKYQGIATSTNSSDTLTVKLYFGGLTGTALLTGTATDVANDNIFCGEFELTCRTAGTAGTMVGFGHHSDVPAASGTATPVYEILASTAVNTTTTQVIGVGVDWSAASTSNSCRLDVFSVDLL